jgi:hypothetical protein
MDHVLRGWAALVAIVTCSAVGLVQLSCNVRLFLGVKSASSTARGTRIDGWLGTEAMRESLDVLWLRR